MNLRVQELLAEVDVLWDQARTLSKTAHMEGVLIEDNFPSLATYMATNAANLRMLADLQNAMADRYAEVAELLTR